MTRKNIPTQTRFSVLSRDRFTCRYCSRSAPEVELQIDHVKAVANGGSNELENLVTACAECNAGKSASDVPFVPAPASTAKGGGRRHPLVGFGVLSFKGGKLNEQGLILDVVDDPAGGLAIVQFFEWMMGEPSYARLIPLAHIAFDEASGLETKTWRLFTSNDERNSYHDHQQEYGHKFKGEQR